MVAHARVAVHVDPGLTTSPLSFLGTLSSNRGFRSLSLDANAPSIKSGDITVTDALLKIRGNDVAGLSAVVQGTVDVGPSSASGIVNVAFDRVGTLQSVNVDVVAHLVGTQPGGKVADLIGHVKLNGNAQETTAASPARDTSASPARTPTSSSTRRAAT